MLAAILALGGTIVMLTSCSSDNENNENGDGSRTVTPETVWTEPATDQMRVSVTAKLTPASLSQFETKSAGTALIRRLPLVSASITDDTDFVLLKGSDAVSLSDDVMARVANVLAMGGYVALERPTVTELDNFMDRIDKAIAAVVEDYVSDLFVAVTPEQMAATVNASMAGRMRMRRANLAEQTRLAAADKACAELIVFGPEDCYFAEPLNDRTQVITYYTDTDGNRLDEEGTETFEEMDATEYHYGLVADGAAQWINDIDAMYSKEDAWYKTDSVTPRAARRAALRADGMSAINDMMNATETFTKSFQVYFRTYDASVQTNKNYILWGDRVTMTLRTWGVHHGDCDFYYVNQNVLLSMGLNDNMDLFFCRHFSPQDWLEEINKDGGKTGNRWYGNFLTQFDTSLDLKPVDTKSTGVITCMAATPETANQVTTQTVDAKDSHSQTSTVTHTATATVGWTNGSFGATFQYDCKWGMSVTDGNSFAMTNAKRIKDLDVVKNTLGTKVTWTYKGKRPKTSGPGNVIHEQPADILVNDANLVNDACWSVRNPNGQYALNVASWPVTGVLLLNAKGQPQVMETKTTWDNEWNVTLTQPCRSVQKWRMFVRVLEWTDGFREGAMADLQQALMRKFPDLFQSTFEVGELTDESVKNATAYILYSQKVFDVYKDILQGMAKSYGIKKFRITWSGDKNLETKQDYEVMVE